MGTAAVYVMRKEARCLIVTGVVVLIYYIIMDVFTIYYYQRQDLAHSSKYFENNEIYSPFKHLTVKGIMADHTTQYVFQLSAEYFDYLTDFSCMFFFITPNMISLGHLCTSVVCLRLVSSEELEIRRYGALLYQFRNWLDSLDGVVVRRRSLVKMDWEDDHRSLGYFLDDYFDIFGGIFLMFGVYFYLCKQIGLDGKDLLPWKQLGVTDLWTCILNRNRVQTSQLTCSKRSVVFWVSLYGFTIALAGKFWTVTVADYKELFQTPIHDADLSAEQNKISHSCTTLTIMWLWRLVEGKAMLQYVVLALWLDKVWEFVKVVPCLGLSVVIPLYAASVWYGRHVRALLQM